MTDVEALALFARNDLTRQGLRDAAERRGLTVIGLGPDPESIDHAARTGVAFRAPGGLMALAMDSGHRCGCPGQPRRGSCRSARTSPEGRGN